MWLGTAGGLVPLDGKEGKDCVQVFIISDTCSVLVNVVGLGQGLRDRTGPASKGNPANSNFITGKELL